MKVRQSRKVGFAAIPGASSPTAAMVYEALVSIACKRCEREIVPGEQFTRHQQQNGGQRSFPFCSTCEPFTPPRPR